MSVATTKGKTAEYDLHLHTYWSYDATNEVEPYFRFAHERGMRAIAITEHHNLDALEESLAAATRYPEVNFIIAAELSVNTSIGPVDLVCLGLPAKPTGVLAEVLVEYNQWQRDSGAGISRGMEALGLDFSDAERLELLRSYRPERIIAVQGNTHVQNGRLRAHFHSKGFIDETPDSYSDLMKRVSKLGARPPYPAVERVVPAVKAAGGLVVIAHPTHYFNTNDRKRMDALREECDLDGVECAHPSVVPELTAFYREYCLEHGLVSTGGSDSHNPTSLAPAAVQGYTRDVHFGCHIGEPEWLEELLERLN